MTEKEKVRNITIRIPYDIWKRLQEEARDAFRNNQIPVKPDLQQLVQE